MAAEPTQSVCPVPKARSLFRERSAQRRNRRVQRQSNRRNERLTFTVDSNAVPGTYPVTITGSSTASTIATSIIRLTVETGDGGTDAGGDASAEAASDATVANGCASGATVISLGACGGTAPFSTTGPVCVKVKASVVNGWNASNVQGRTVEAQGASTQGPVAPTAYGGIPNQPGLSAGPDGFVYFNFTAGQVSYSTMACW